jgi:type I restriction enzyme S subunit
MLRDVYPRDWEQVPLKNLVLKFLNGGTPSTAHLDYWNGTIPWITGADAEHQTTLTARKYITEKGVRESATNIVPKGNILLVTRTGVGKVSIAGVDVAISQDLTGLIPNSDVIDTCYLCRQLSRLGPDLERLAQGTIIQGVQREQVESLQIPRPLLAEQRRIAVVLDSVDDAIIRTEAVIAKLKQVRAGLVHDLLTSGINDNGELRDPAAHPTQFHAVNAWTIPTAWDVRSIGQLAAHVGSGITPRGGSNVYRSKGVLFVRSQNVTFEGLLLDDVAYIDEQTHKMMARSEIFPHDVLINITGASIGRCCPFPQVLGQANVNQHVCAVRLTNPRREDAVFLSAVLASFIGQRQVDRFNAGSNRQGLNYEQLKSFKIPWPKSDNERIEIASLVERHDELVVSEERELLKLRAMRNGLAKDLLTGHVRVPKAIQA